MFSGLLIPNNCVEGLGEGLAKLVQSRPQKTPRRPKKIQSVDPQLQLGSIFDLKAHELLIRCRWGSGSNRGRVESIGRRGFWEWRRHRKRRVEWGNRKWRWARPGSGGCVGATGTRGHDGKWFHFLKTGSQHKKTPQAIHSTSIKLELIVPTVPRLSTKKGEITKWTTFLFIIFCTTIEIKRKVAGRELEVDFFIWAIYIVWLHIKTIR